MKVVSSGKSLKSLKNDPPTNADKCEPLFVEGNRILAEARKLLQEGLASDFAALFDVYPKIRTLQLSGYTPIWNDGDPCFHSQEDPIINGFRMWTSRDGEPPGRVSQTTENQVRSYTESEAENLEAAFGTNWCLNFTRTADGFVEFELSEYDCGH